MKPLDRSRSIRLSIRVFIYGVSGILSVCGTFLLVWIVVSSEFLQKSVPVILCAVLGLLPLTGLISAVSALSYGMRIRRGYAEPNPANHYRKWGMALGVLGVLLNCCAAAMVIAKLFVAAERGYWFDNG